MHLVLDTNVLHQENLSSANMKTLLRLVESGYVTLCIPTLVRREYVTKVISECTAKFQAASSHLDHVGKIARISSMHSRINEFRGDLGRLKSEMAGAYEADFALWAEAYGVQELPFEAGMIESVLDDYFAGATPYRSPKSREDILDSMIGKTVDALIDRVGDVGVVVKDGTFKRHLEQQGRAKIFDGLENFLLFDPVKAELDRLDTEANIGTLLEALIETKDSLGEFAKGSQSLLNTIYLEDDEVSGVERLDMDCFGVRVNGPEVGDVLSLRLDEVEYLGKGQFAMAFVMEARTQVDYCASYGDFLDHEREEHIVLTSMNGAGICDLQEIRPVRICGKLIFETGREGGVRAMQAAIAAGDFDAQSLEFEATAATLLSA